MVTVPRSPIRPMSLREFVGLEPPPVHRGSRIARSSPGIGIGPTKSGRESNPPVRSRPPAAHQRSERPGTPNKEN